MSFRDAQTSERQNVGQREARDNKQKDLNQWDADAETGEDRREFLDEVPLDETEGLNFPLDLRDWDEKSSEIPLNLARDAAEKSLVVTKNTVMSENIASENDETCQASGLLPGKIGDTIETIVEDAESGWRLDLFLAYHFPQYSRVFLRKAIQSEGVFVDGKRGKPSFRLKPGQNVSYTLLELPRESPIPEDIPLEVLYEDDDLAVINKPADMVVHPSRGHWAGTLVGALAHRYAGQLSEVRGPARPGIVHRLDRDTSGVILIAKNDFSHAKLAAQFESKEIQKEYFAIVLGGPNVDRDVVDLPIGHHPKQREKMRIALDDPEAKSAVTFFEVTERFRGFSTVRVLPKTGRTHQIRVHLTHYGCPILCDRLYGGRTSLSLGEIVGKVGLPAFPADEEQQEAFSRILLNRQALHARKITFTHPISGRRMSIEAPLPADIAQTLEALRQWRSNQPNTP